MNKPKWAEREEWVKIARGCYERGIFTFLKRGQLLTIDGKPAVDNTTGAGRGEYFHAGEVLRLVMNLDVCKSIMAALLGDIMALSYPGQWNAVFLEEGQVFVHSTSDLNSAYYCFGGE